MMKYCILLLLFCLLIPQAAMSSGTYLGWFTDATISDSGLTTTKLSTPPGAPPATTGGGGTKSEGVNMTSTTFTGVTFAVGSMSNTARGMISFWIRPTENGKLTSGGTEHVLLASGTPASNGLQISWDNAKGVLRFSMAGGSKVTRCRADISSWTAQDWHHVQVGWFDLYGNGVPVGLAIWIDKVAVASCIYGGTAFMSAPTGNNVTLGSSTSKCYMDELIFRGDSYGLDSGYAYDSANAYNSRDFYRTAPYTAIQITNMPNKVTSDTWVLASKKKQFGLTGTRKLNTSTGATTTDYLTNFDKQYWPEAEFDAKPYITWSISGGTGATVDGNGLVTGGSSAVTRTLNASFAGLTAPGYSLVVRRWTGGSSYYRADLGIKYIERLPRYERDATKKWPATSDVVTTVAHIGNFGTKSSGTYYVKCERYTDSNNNFKVDDGGAWTQIGSIVSCASLANSSTSEKVVSWTWSWPSNGLTTGSYFIRVTVDCGSGGGGGTIAEICEANNVRTEKINAKSFQWAYRQSRFNSDYTNRVVNLVGSFSDYDWYNAETDRISRVMQDAVYPTTSTNGIWDSIRVDKFTEWYDYANRDDEPSLQAVQYFDGHFDPWGDSGTGPMDYDNAVGHEIGHTTLGLPDLYGQNSETDNCFVKDSGGAYYGGTVIYPITRNWAHIAMHSSAVFDYADEVGIGYDSLMCGCHLGPLGLGKMCAGIVHYNRQTRNDLGDYWGGMFADWIPSTNTIKLYDANDNDLTNARIYVYQLTCSGEWYVYGNRFYSDRYKFVGNSNSSGQWSFPSSTCTYWDDWSTDANDGVVSLSNPFAASANEVQIPTGAQGDVFLIKVVGANSQVEFHLLPLTEFNAAYLSGSTGTATYPIRTSLTSPGSAPAIVAPIDAAGGQAPVARMSYNGLTYDTNSEILVTAGTNVTLNATVSSDPEGFTPLRYRWTCSDGAYSSQTSLSINTTGWSVGDTYDASLVVIDSVRYSNKLTITIRIASPTANTGRVTDSGGSPVAGAIVGFKTSVRATADANYYAVTDGNGDYLIDGLPSGTYYVAAWADGYTPCADSTVAAGGVKNLQLTQTEGTNLCLSASDVWATSENPSESLWADLAADGDIYTRWGSDYYVEDCTWYVDFGTSRSVRAATIYWEWSRPSAYSIDYTTGDPHNGGSTWTTAYSTTQGDGYWLSDNYHLDPIRFASPITARGMRVHCTQFLNSIIQSAWEFEFHAN